MHVFIVCDLIVSKRDGARQCLYLKTKTLKFDDFAVLDITFQD